uniref:Uncharacterized protein n=1 Tax=Anguilla anguilla TaxID=7936 RepID=A0A0E9XSW1_ANGAN
MGMNFFFQCYLKFLFFKGDTQSPSRNELATEGYLRVFTLTISHVCLDHFHQACLILTPVFLRRAGGTCKYLSMVALFFHLQELLNRYILSFEAMSFFYSICAFKLNLC